jgi:hypothetical protein
LRRALLAWATLLLAVMALSVPAAEAAPARTLSVTGDGAEMFPAFDPSIDRYALATATSTAGTVDVSASPGPGETVTIDGGSTTHLTGVQPGHEISVAFSGGESPHTYTVIYLPAGFPRLTVAGGARSSFPGVQPGLIALTPNTFAAGSTDFLAVVDRNGVPIHAEAAPFNADLKQQPNDEITVSRPTTSGAPHTGYALTTLDDQFEETARREVGGALTNTDMHDSVRLLDGTTILIGYEPNSVTGNTDATIQKLDVNGDPTFTWSSAGYAAETMKPGNADYAHINSVVSVENGDIIASFRHLSAAYRIATVAHDGYAQGDIIWKLGGKDSTFTFPNDPLGGPCGQHTVSELANGHILVFDNGTDGLCVNPADPTGAAIDRGQTRVTEYALDTSAGQPTATLVWSYTPPGKYSAFAGSARRMPNGNTLIDWASDRSALATEINSAGQTVWELHAADPAAGQQRYASYRADLITLRLPHVTVDGPADGARFLIGDTATAGATCADWRGDPLATCGVTGLVGGRLDTATAGARTWQAVASDGAGNSTTVLRHYTVVSGRRPDGLIRKAGSTWWRGGNVYGSPAEQTVRQHVPPRHTAASVWRIQNDGARADSFRLRASSGTARFRVRFLLGTTDVTAAVVAGTYQTGVLAPGAQVSLKVKVVPTRRARPGTVRTFVLRATSTTDTAAVDVVATRVTTRR